MSLIGAGAFQRKSANFGLGKVAELEARENAQQDALTAADKAAEGQLYSTGAGIGGAYGVQQGLSNAKATKDAVGSLNSLIKGGEVGTQGGSLTFTPAGGDLLSGAEATKTINELASSADAALKVQQGAEATGAVVEGAGALVEGTGALVESGALAADAVVAAETAAASSSTLGTLSTIAAPVAIGLGVAFLLNKLFD